MTKEEFKKLKVGMTVLTKTGKEKLVTSVYENKVWGDGSGVATRVKFGQMSSWYSASNNFLRDYTLKV